MNWLDLLILLLLGLAAARGYKRGFIIEVCSFMALWIGVYVALKFNVRVAEWIGLGSERTITAFLITFMLVLALVHLLAKTLTTLIDLALLGWANKIAGIGAAILRSAFALSITLNLLMAYTEGNIPPATVREGSALATPIRNFAPLLLPPLRESKWVKQMLDELKAEAEHWKEEFQKKEEDRP